MDRMYPLPNNTTNIVIDHNDPKKSNFNNSKNIYLDIIKNPTNRFCPVREKYSRCYGIKCFKYFSCVAELRKSLTAFTGMGSESDMNLLEHIKEIDKFIQDLNK